MSEDRPTWWQIVSELPDMIKIDIENGHLDIGDDEAVEVYAHEWADGSEYVIYTHHAMRLWCESNDVSDYEDEAWDLLDPDRTTVHSVSMIMSSCVFLALRQAIIEACEELRNELDGSE